MSAFRPPELPELRRSPPHGRVLVLAPHPDDETMGCGGVLTMHARQGDEITALFICNGIQGDPDSWYPRDEIVGIRQEEARAAADIIGIGHLEFMGYPDGLTDADMHQVFEGLPSDPDEARRALASALVDRLGPMLDDGGFDIVYYPWDGEANADHWLIGQAVTQLRAHRPDLDARISFMGFEVWSGCIPDTLVDISDVMDNKLKAITAYPSQELYVDYTHAARGLGAYRSLMLERGATYGEAFVGRFR